MFQLKSESPIPKQNRSSKKKKANTSVTFESTGKKFKEILDSHP